ncbi:RNA 2'-phosphotransferase [Planctomicrobium piriforme]|uniref:Probable RNA 2'-phosphotransferase n=1 Tax=Planctomicrobium piriforme TaxID=1576369 RepID=A0A1I3IGH0_9PLAN|nr:RNA 2'-phosphotransferase [Planctomicrobium piriforme]SFI46969.1 putative RNA 2'-phosphotransferase [Planctomicrobium piriforme]
MNPTHISKALSHALRHEPWLYELELDDEGWTDVARVLAALRKHEPDWAGLTIDDLTAAVHSGDKQRHEIDGHRIRAIYGHSIAGKLKRVPALPPESLFHGTAPAVVEQIRISGLLPMQRQYVHCSVDIDMAKKVGQRKALTPVILTIQARQASEQGVAFYEGNDLVWLADAVPPEFIEFSPVDAS